MDIKAASKIAVLTIALSGFIAIYYLFNPSQVVFIPCPLYFTTGLYCPGCGSQRAIHALLHVDIVSAFRFNPLMVLTMPILIYGLGITLTNWVKGTRYRFMLFYSKFFIYGYFGTALVYWVLRNIPYAPFNILAPMTT